MIRIDASCQTDTGRANLRRANNNREPYYPIEDIVVTDHRVTFRLRGVAALNCRLRLISSGRALPKVKLIDTATGRSLPGTKVRNDREFMPAGGAALTLTWS